MSFFEALEALLPMPMHNLKSPLTPEKGFSIKDKGHGAPVRARVIVAKMKQFHNAPMTARHRRGEA
jgi:hypothetical protein